MDTRVRFAPSPTGQVHIGNIRTAIFNWLFARHTGGKFLLRVEDTDRQRSTPEAIAALMEVMEWLGLDVDEDPLYQSSRADAHRAAAAQLVEQGKAYRFAKGEGGEATLFRIPWKAKDLPFVREAGEQRVEIHRDVPFRAGVDGISYALRTKKGKAAPAAACLAGFRDLQVLDDDGTVRFELEPVIDRILDGEEFIIEGARRIVYTRLEVVYQDIIKGELAKPLDSMKDFVIVRSDGHPVFHLGNVCDDAQQQVTHIIRGNDHVENTYRHLFLFDALGQTPPQYAHLPMIVNKQGKPYSKRDGDAFVGDFRAKGFQAEALFNYLTLLGWSPGDGREKMSREELVAAFTLERVQSSDAQMDPKKLEHLNGQYLAELPLDVFTAAVKEVLGQQEWFAGVPEEQLEKVAALMQSRTKLFTDAAGWQYLFSRDYPFDEKQIRKALQKPGRKEELSRVAVELDALDDYNAETIEAAIHRATDALDIKQGKLNLPLRVAVTGTNIGAGLYEIFDLLGKDEVRARLAGVVATHCTD